MGISAFVDGVEFTCVKPENFFCHGRCVKINTHNLPHTCVWMKRAEE